MSIQQIQYNGQTYDIDAPDGTKPEDYLKYARQAEIAHLKQTSSQETDEEKKLKGEDTGKEKTQAEWDAEPATQKATDMLHWGAGVLRGATGVRVGDTDTSPLSQAETNAREHPILFGTGVAGELVAPTIIAGVKASGPAGGVVRGVRTAAADALRHPVAEAAATGADLANNPMATIMRRGQGPINRVRDALASMMDPGPLAQVDRYMPNSGAAPSSAPLAESAPPLQTDVQALVDRYMPNRSGAAPPSNPVAGADLGQSARDILSPKAQSMMDAMHGEANPVFKQMQADGQFNRTNMPAAGSDPDLAAWMRGEGKVPYASPTEPVPPSPNAGGRLVTRPSLPAVDLGPAGPNSVSLPDQPQPVVTMSPQARQIANMRSTSQLDSLENTMRTREQGAAAQRYSPDLKVVDQGAGAPAQATVTPQAAKSMFDQMQENLKAIPAHGDQEVSVKSGDTVMKHKTAAPKPQAPPPTEDLWTKTDADTYKELAGKAFKTPHEWQIFDTLDRIMKMRASAMGRGYAAGGK